MSIYRIEEAFRESQERSDQRRQEQQDLMPRDLTVPESFWILITIVFIVVILAALKVFG